MFPTSQITKFAVVWVLALAVRQGMKRVAPSIPLDDQHLDIPVVTKYTGIKICPRSKIAIKQYLMDSKMMEQSTLFLYDVVANNELAFSNFLVQYIVDKVFDKWARPAVRQFMPIQY